MVIDRSIALNGFLLLAGLSLVAVPVVAPADVPPDRVEYYVEADWHDNPDQSNLAYGNFSEAERAVFDAALERTPDEYNATADEAPASLTPEPDSIDIYNVRYDGSYYLLQVKHLTHSADLVTDLLPRVGAGMLGVVLLIAAAYRRFV